MLNHPLRLRKNLIATILQHLIFVVMIFFIISSHESALASQVKITISPNSTPKTTGYNLYYGKTKDFSHKVDLGTELTYLASNLQEGTTYYFAATSYDKYDNESKFSKIFTFTVPAKPEPDGNLSGFSQISPAIVDLTSEGVNGWGHWGLNTDSDVNLKSILPQQISNFTLIGWDLPKRYSDTGVTFTWNDGSPTAGSSGTSTGIFLTGSGNGYMLTVPADSDPRTLRIYIGGDNVRSCLEASLSDNIVEPYVEYFENFSGIINQMVTLNFTASEPSLLTVRYRIVEESEGSKITLMAATLKEEAANENKTYTIGVTAGSGGSISPSENIEIAHGGTQVFSITPDPGKKINDVLVDGKSVGALSTFTFNNVISDRTISVSFKDIPNIQIPHFAEMSEVFVDHNWQRVEFKRTFISPIVVAKPASFNDSDPAIVRIRNVDRNGFDIRIQEWDYLDDIHLFENVSYIVMEKGFYILPGNLMVKAGMFKVDSKSSHFEPFAKSFNQKPVVIASVTTVNQPNAVDGRINKISKCGFKYRLQEQELNSPWQHGVETVSFIAFERFSCVLDGFMIEAAKTEVEVTHDFHNIDYNPDFPDVVFFLADMQTANELDTANLRYRRTHSLGLEVHISEEQSGDEELIHENESVGYLMIKKQ